MTNGRQTQRTRQRVTYPRGEHRHDIEPEKCGHINCEFSPEFTAENAFQRQNPLDIQRRWVESKRLRPTSVHLIKIGGFYEAFHQDADVIVDEFENCLYMFGRTAHTGFPASCIQRFVTELTDKDYEVVLIE